MSSIQDNENLPTTDLPTPMYVKYPTDEEWKKMDSRIPYVYKYILRIQSSKYNQAQNALKMVAVVPVDIARYALAFCFFGPHYYINSGDKVKITENIYI